MKDPRCEDERVDSHRGEIPTRTNNDRRKKKKKEEKCTSKITNFFKIVKSSEVNKSVQINEGIEINNGVEMKKSTRINNGIEVNKSARINNGIEVNKSARINNGIEVNKSARINKSIESSSIFTCQDARPANEHSSDVSTMINFNPHPKDAVLKQIIYPTCDENLHNDVNAEGETRKIEHITKKQNPFSAPPSTENELKNKKNRISINSRELSCGITNIKSILSRDANRVTTVESPLKWKEDEVWKLEYDEENVEEIHRKVEAKMEECQKHMCDKMEAPLKNFQNQSQDSVNKTKRGFKRKKKDSDEINVSLNMNIAEKDDLNSASVADSSNNPELYCFPNLFEERNNNSETCNVEPSKRDIRNENSECSSPSPSFQNCTKVVKARKISLVNFFGDDIQITVNVNEGDDISKDGLSSADSDESDTSLGCTRNGVRSSTQSGIESTVRGNRIGRKVRHAEECVDKAEPYRKQNASYKRNSISDGESYKQKNCLIYAKCEKSGNKKQNKTNSSGEIKGEKKLHTNDEQSENEQLDNSPPSEDRKDYLKENKRILKSDNEFELERAKTKRLRIGRIRCTVVGAHKGIGREMKTDANDDNGRKSLSNKSGRKTCLNIGFINNFNKKEEMEWSESNAYMGSAVSTEHYDDDGDDNDDDGDDNDDDEDDNDDDEDDNDDDEDDNDDDEDDNDDDDDDNDDDEDGSEDDNQNHHDQHSDSRETGKAVLAKHVETGDKLGGKAKKKERKKKDSTIRNNYKSKLYELQNNVQEKLTSIKNNFRLNDNVNDILNEKKKIKILRILNKYYFDREYNDYAELKTGNSQGHGEKSIIWEESKLMDTTPRELLRDNSNKPFTFFIAGKFTLFSNFALVRKLKDFGYGITNNLRRSNSLIIGQDLNEDFIKKMSNYNGPIFDEKGILCHLNIDIKKRINLFTPINKNNAKRYKFMLNETNINNASNSVIEKKIQHFCKMIKKNIVEISDATNSGDKKMLLSHFTRRLNNFFIFLHMAREKFHSNMNSMMNVYRTRYYQLVHSVLNEEKSFEFVLLAQKLCNDLSTCSISDDLLMTTPVGLAHGGSALAEDHMDNHMNTIQSGTLYPTDIYSLKAQFEEDVVTRRTKTHTCTSVVYGKGKESAIEEKESKRVIERENFPSSEEDSSLEYISPDEYFKETNVSGLTPNEEKEAKSEVLNSFEKKITQNMKKSEKLKIVTSLWSVFFRPNSLYEIAGHKNEIFKLYKILKKFFPESDEATNQSCGKHTSKELKQLKYKSNIHQDKNNIIFLVYPPNCGVKRLVELICYACDLCPIYENKVQKYKNINYFFKYTHGLKPISIYNANKLDKTSMKELNLRNDVSICMYEDKNYVINNMSNLPLSLLDNINHILIKFCYPSRKSLFYRCFAVSSCLIKNINKKLFKTLFETCRLKDFSYSIENVYSKMHLMSAYVNYVHERGDGMGSSEIGSGDSCISADANRTCSRGIIQAKGTTKPGQSLTDVLTFPNNVIQAYMSNHLMNRFFMRNYDEIQRDMHLSYGLADRLTDGPNHGTDNSVLSREIIKYWDKNEKNDDNTNVKQERETMETQGRKSNTLKQLNDEYYFFRGFDEEDIRFVVYDWYDKMYIENGNLTFDLSIKKNNNIMDEGNDYLYMDDKSRRDRAHILIKVLELFLCSSILIKSNDININLIAVDMAVYWRKYLFMNPSYTVKWCNTTNRKKIGKKKKKKKKKKKNLYMYQNGTEVTTLISSNNNDFINEVKLKDHFKGKMDKCNKIFSDKVKKYKSLMLHFGCPFNFSSASIVYDILQNNKVVNFALRKHR
ncbi:hypothetical protein, conserved [Plasmodium gonderi]|uniref:Uncharacterized protein n=1 Tax=Plasmodium gonderi TaxID=77519 RepID=A0A1Y1JB59_PLAGO|nr:hypothetical protein, conserved [Plasmodium gonderi]GAW79771.1 hypothetical protein, conserved [Plasmodium gonderi]